MICLLGSTAVSTFAGQVSGKLRTLLATLALYPNQVVTFEDIRQALWGFSPPSSSDNLIRQYVLQLRRVLEGEPSSIETRPSSYLLTATVDDIDRTLFEALVDSAVTSLGVGEVGVAIGLLTRALNLWKGMPLRDVFRSPALEIEASRLEARRVTAIELLLEAKLLNGEAITVRDELQALVAKHPHREKMRELYMSALSESGRRADALRVYRDGRRALVSELGIEPSKPLQSLHEKILENPPALD